MPSADAGASAWKYLHVEVDEAAQSAGIFIVNFKIVDAEITFFGFFGSHNFIILLEGDILDADLFVIHRFFRDFDHRFAGVIAGSRSAEISVG